MIGKMLRQANDICSSYNYNPTALLLGSDTPEFFQSILDAHPHLPAVVVTSTQECRDQLHPHTTTLVKGGRPRVRLLRHPGMPVSDFNFAALFNEFLSEACVAGDLMPDDKLLILLQTEPVPITTQYSMSKLPLAVAMKELQDRVKPAVLKLAVGLCLDLAREGKEGQPVGGLVVIGDTERVMAMSDPSIMNPFRGYTREELSLLRNDRTLEKTVKQMIIMDGAFILDDGGAAVDAGRYIRYGEEAGGGAGDGGGRHRAAAWATAHSKAVAVLLEAEKNIQIWNEGRAVCRIPVI